MPDSEHQYQAMFVSWLESNYPDVLFFAIPNGASLAGRGRQMSRLKSEGLLPGVPDILIAEPRSKYHGLFLEMKTPRGKLSENQEWFIAQADQRNYYTAVCYGFEDARDLVKEYLSWIE